jgi:DNA modification methylase
MSTYDEDSGERPLFGSYPCPPNLLVVQNRELIQFFQKHVSEEDIHRRIRPEPGSERREASKLRKDEWKEWTQSIWEIEPGRFFKYRDSFPRGIPHRLIRMYSFVGDTVLDPFLRSGTTAVAAVTENRYYVGHELDPNRCQQARQRVADIQ